MTIADHTRATTLLHSMLGPDAAFRDGQWEAISSVLDQGSRTLVVQRTGWGKSLVYFLATKLLREQGAGPTLLISPLLALMSDQIRAAERIGIRAATINSTNVDEWAAVREAIANDEVDIILISPERLANPKFRQEMLPAMQGSIALLVVDEAHCISDWGHDFRPDYRRIVRIVQDLPPNVSVLGTTATANNRVIEDVAEQIGPNLKVSRGPLGRESLELQAIDLPDQAARMAWLAERVPDLPGSGIIYTLTVRDADRIAEWLRSEGIDAHAYHAGLDRDQRPELEQKLRDNEIKALVATVALGMGFDKPDLGWVVHYQRPGSVVAYYQQIGRAGRATDRATCVLLSGREDDAIHDFFLGQAFPPADLLREVADAVGGAGDGLSVRDLEGHINKSQSRIEQCLKILEVDGIVDRDRSRYVRTAAPLVLDEERTQRVVDLRKRELQQMRDFMTLDTCLMEFAVKELDDPSAAPCGRCAVCRGGLLPTTTDNATNLRALAFVNRSHFPIEPRKQAPPALTAGNTRKIPEEMQVELGFALSTYGDAGHGRMVRYARTHGEPFAEELVDAAVEFIRKTWEPPVTWVTAVPSLRQPELVPDVARRIAEKLGLPFSVALECKELRSPQKEMFNSEMAAGNAAAAFRVLPDGVQAGPVLLVDDVVDSRWTIAMCGARLRRAGAEEVFPLALGTASGLGDW